MDLMILNSCPLFHGVTQEELLSMLGCLDAREQTYSRGATVFREGEPAQWVGVVLEGEVHIIKEDYAGNRSVIGAVGPGQLFGEVFACAGVEQLPVSAVATMDTRVLLLSCLKIITTCPNSCPFHAGLIHNLLHIVARKNLMLNQKIEFISKKTTREKLLSFLSAHAKAQGNKIFTIPYDRQALADYLGVERSAMSAELGKMKREGLLDFHKNQFRFLK